MYRAVIIIREIIDVEEEYRRRIEYERRMACVRVIDEEINRLAVCIANEQRRDNDTAKPYPSTQSVDMECPHCRGCGNAWRVSRSWFRTHTYDICSVCYGKGRIPVEVSRPILRRRD
jgi:hypothetical protein